MHFRLCTGFPRHCIPGESEGGGDSPCVSLSYADIRTTPHCEGGMFHVEHSRH